MIGRTLLQRIARRCPVHDRSSRHRIRSLEASLGLPPLDTGMAVSFVEEFANPDLVDCGLAWCRTRARPGG